MFEYKTVGYLLKDSLFVLFKYSGNSYRLDRLPFGRDSVESLDHNVNEECVKGLKRDFVRLYAVPKELYANIRYLFLYRRFLRDIRLPDYL